MPRNSAFAAAFAAILLPSTTALADSFDGAWQVTIVTQQGTCDKAYSYPLVVRDGVIRYVGITSVEVSGKIETDGNVQVRIALGDRSAQGAGRLSDKSGTGTWIASNKECSGRWTASKAKA